MLIKVNNKDLYVNDDEFMKITYKEYNNLQILNNLALFERLISLFNELKKVLLSDLIKYCYFINTTHGGFMPIEISPYFDNVILIDTKAIHSSNIFKNLLKHKTQNIVNYQNRIEELTTLNNCILFTEEITNELLDSFIINKNVILITTNNLSSSQVFNYTFHLSNTNYYIHFNDIFYIKFCEVFKYYIEEKYILNYNNLLNVCIMVKNAGPQFEEMLLNNLHLMDRWTILDTGSTDDTINIINKVLINKNGKLYQEPFINFKDSRNRLLELAGYTCKFNIILDDTYVVKGNLYKFLNEIRGDQYSNSLSLFIKSNDIMYNSNRIIKSTSNLKYQFKIHETISDYNNINIFIPEEEAFILDRIFEYMDQRTMERKANDLILLYEELTENPMNPRTYYYLGQTYNLQKNYEKAYENFIKRAEFVNSGFIQERYDAIFETARLANFQLNKSWDECLYFYNKCIKLDETRPEPFYFIGIHYYLENNFKLAYQNFKEAFRIGFPIHCQYSLKPTLSFYFLPYFLTKVCYELHDYKLGEISAELFLSKNKSDDINYNEVLAWYNIYKKLNVYTGSTLITSITDKPICCFIADGGFSPWSGENIITTGVGGSETFIIEIANHIQKSNKFITYVFCNTPENKEYIYQDTIYKPISQYFEFINTNYIHTCIVSRFSEYLPVTFKGHVDNVYFIVHDLSSSGNVIPIEPKLRQIFCLTEWHTEYFTKSFNLKELTDITVPFYYGTNFMPINNSIITNKIRFIYSSFPNRGLLILLKMWSKIYEINNNCELHIFCDVNNHWSNITEPDKMREIKDLLEQLSNKYNIYYHGWVSKKELEKGWQQSDIWFYPCTFMETFCLTALEAARTRTLVITNDLAGLQNTVNNRGVIIKGDPTTSDWQQHALIAIRYYLNTDNKEMREKFIEMNYKWSLNYTWENQANKLLNEYLLKNSLDVKLMYNWTNDIPKGSKIEILNSIKLLNKNHEFVERIKILEIGTYTGISLINFVNLLPNSYGIGVDIWENNKTIENGIFKNMSVLGIEESFYKNITTAKLQTRIIGIKQKSTDFLISCIKSNTRFHLIYVDGSHLLLHTYSDIIMAWNILEKNGIMIIDDYIYNKDDILNSPYEAVNQFLNEYTNHYNLLYKSYRVIIEKTV
jgi:predicted O-methyltransferase YrrM